MDMLAETAAFHHASRALMEAVVHVINLVALDGGAPAPVLPQWLAFHKKVQRSTSRIRKKYFICPHGCKEGVSELNMKLRASDRIPTRCTACHEDIKIAKEEVPQWILRHMDVKESLAAVLSHPGMLQ